MQNEPIFEEHLEVKEAVKKIKEGKLFEGKYMDEKSYFKIGRQIYKVKLENNRAIFGDVVAIEMEAVEKWERRLKSTATE
jgi:hypothetical protein